MQYWNGYLVTEIHGPVTHIVQTHLVQEQNITTVRKAYGDYIYTWIAIDLNVYNLIMATVFPKWKKKF